MSKPHKLELANALINPKLVSSLEVALGRARKGEATGFVVVVMEPGHWYWSESSFDNRLEIAGALAFASNNVLEAK